ncbi:hypothetical protein RRG08_000614 [Elysia crispata]|uniref:Uncharacterized protein n=1 Tax=Elysia crispata TaxID=231223 RepID=A0AAE1CUU0_9GAST|nr:hypothetical protein RRG08_000614 [Elysia crispata]
MDRPGITRTVGIVNLLTLGDMSRYVYGGTMPQQFEIELQRFRDPSGPHALSFPSTLGSIQLVGCDALPDRHKDACGAEAVVDVDLTVLIVQFSYDHSLCDHMPILLSIFENVEMRLKA